MKEEKLKGYELFYVFLFGCLMGWLIEGIWTLVKKGQLINHSALVIGPFNIVYGIGAVVLTLVLYKFQSRSGFEIFSASFFTGSVLEYILSYLMELIFGFVAWNYRSKPFNLNGRICLTYSIFWGLLGLVWIKLVYPKL